MQQQQTRGVLVDPRTGKKPGSTREQVQVFDWDEIGFAVSTPITDTLLFQTNSKRPQYRSQSIPFKYGRQTFWQYIQVVHNLAFTLTNAGLALSTQQYFENNSFLVFKIEDRETPPIPLSALVPWTIAANGTSLSVVQKLSPYYKLPEPIVVPENGQFEAKFVAAIGLTTSASVPASTPVLPYLINNLAGDTGYSIRFNMLGVLDRSA